jgi:hypothetical protein
MNIPARFSVRHRLSGEGKYRMALLDALVVAVGAWLLLLFVAGVVANARQR